LIFRDPAVFFFKLLRFPRMSRFPALLFCGAFVLGWPDAAAAQVRDAFTQGVADFVNAANGLSGDEGPALTAAINAMAAGLAQWDGAVAKVEAGLAAEIGGAPPPVAARMRAALGAVYLERGRWDAALKQFDTAVDLDPGIGDVQYLRGLLHLRANRPREAEDAFRSTLQRDAGNVTSAYFVLRAASKRREADETTAMKTVSDAVENGASANRPQFIVLDFLNEAAVTAPVFVPAVYSDAAALLVKADYASAISSLRKIVGDKSLAAARDERARLATAERLIETGNPSAARAALEDVIRAFPNSGAAHWRLGRLQEALGDERAALKSFQAAARLPSLGGAANVYARIGRIQHNQLDLDGAISAYETRVELAPNDAAAHLDLGDVDRAQDRFDEALAEYLIAAMLDPANIKALATAAQIHAAEGRDAAAVALLRRAVTLDASHLEARYALGRALMRLGQTEEGRRELQVFEQLQQKAMQDERRRFEENQIRIEETLKGGERRESGR
jgi:tetratricopeptide (TPR) repeat protein